jgi:hypothetical protein
MVINEKEEDIDDDDEAKEVEEETVQKVNTEDDVQCLFLPVNKFSPILRGNTSH